MSGEANPVYDAIRTRRVTRQMDARPVEPADLDRVVRAARYAPNAGNRRLQPVIPVSSPRLLQLLRLVAPGMLPRPAAAAVICIDVGRAAGFGFRSDAPGLFVDVGTTAATMLLAAHAIGLASCPVTSFSRAAVARLLGLGDSMTPRLIVCLGHAADAQPPPMAAVGTQASRPGVNR
ncbi:MAG TPA: nitroreductase family protein [Acidimicrobiales bacterium]